MRVVAIPPKVSFLSVAWYEPVIRLQSALPVIRPSAPNESM
jgi:hypothetical protein